MKKFNCNQHFLIFRIGNMWFWLAFW